MIKKYLKFIHEITEKLDRKPIGKMITALEELQKNKGRLFILGVGGSLANASHAVNDFRKLCEIDAYTFENLAELTARINDDGWENCFKDWLMESGLNENDMVMVFSVGGGSIENKISMNLVKALDYAKAKKAFICGIVGRDGGYTKKVANTCLIIPTVNQYLVTPFVESFQALIWHLLVFHPSLNINNGLWEEISLKK